jgi:hypothetical protein
VVSAEDPACVASPKTRVSSQDDNMVCLSGRDLSEYDYISVSRDGIVPVNMKPMSMT